MATITQTIRNYLEPYWNDRFCISDTDCIKTIEDKIFKACGLDYKINNFDAGTPRGTVLTYYVLSWIEDGKLQTHELIVEDDNRDYWEDEEVMK